MVDYTREQPKEVSLPPRLPLIGVIDERPGELDRDSKLVNGYIERTDDGELHVVKRPGMELRYAFGANRYGAGMFENLFFFQQPVEGGTTFSLYNTETLISSTIGQTTAPFDPGRLVYATNIAWSPFGLGVAFHTRSQLNLYLVGGSAVTNIPFNGKVIGPADFSTTSGSNLVVSELQEVVPIYSGIEGAGIPANTSVQLSLFLPGPLPLDQQLTLSQNATATASAASLTIAAAGPNARTSYTFSPSKQLVPGIVGLNAALFVCNPLAEISNSDRGALLAWNPLSSIQAYLSESQPLYIIRQLGYIFLFKSEIIEVFRDAGLSPGSPLNRQEGMTIEVGISNSNTLASIDGMIFWCSQTESGKRSVWMLQGGRAREIASPAVSRVVSRSNPDNGHAFSASGHTFYALTDPSAPYTLVYDATSNFWSYWTALDEEYWPFVAATRWAGETLLQHRTNGNIYQLDPLVFADDHSEFTMDIYPPEFDSNIKTHKFLSKLYVVGDQQDGSVLELRFNDNNREEDAWSDWYEARLDEERPRIDDLGSFVKRAFHIRHTRPTPCRLRAIELDLMLGMS